MDLTKVFAIIFMVFIHTLVVASVNLSSGIGYVFDSILGAQFAAPVFMFCMGAGIAYSRKNDTKSLIKRGIYIFILGFVLNILRAIPDLVLYFITKSMDYLQSEVIGDLIGLDILQFAGLALILFALLKKSKSMALMIGVPLILSLLGSYFRMIDTGNTALNTVLGLFIGTKCEMVIARFPLFNWFIFVVAGYLFAIVIRRCTNLTKFYIYALTISFVIVMTYMTLNIPAGIGMYNENELYFYHMGITDAFISIMSAILLISVCYFITKLLPKGVINVIKNVSTNVNIIYFVQWIVIIWVVAVFIHAISKTKLSINSALLIGAAITVVSIALGCLIGNLIKKLKQRKTTK